MSTATEQPITEPIDSKAPAAPQEEHAFQAEVNMLMSLIVNTIYSNHEVFLRELVSNASDALDKIRFQALSDPKVLESEPELKIQLIPDEENNTLTIRDTGIGMTKDDLIQNLGTIAHSGTRGFMEAVKAGADVSMIGQFGVGFYSAFLVAEKVTVISKNNDDKQYIWESQAGGKYTISQDTSNNIGRGTAIILHLKSDRKEYLKPETLTNLIKKHSQYISHRIEIQKVTEKDVEVEEPVETPPKTDTEEGAVEDAPEEGETKKTTKKVVEKSWEHLNTQEPIWMKPKDTVTHEEYATFFKSLGSDWEDHLAVSHFRVEGGLDFRAILFVPPRPPFDLFNASKKRNNLKLYVRRVFIMDDCEDLCPEWLGFIKGIVDSEDLPLNLSRESLQHHNVLTLIRRNIVRKALTMFKELAEDEEKYEKFYKNFSKNLKLGVHEDTANRKKLLNLLRFNSTKKGDTLTSLSDYIDRMPAGQDKIYYLIGETLDSVKSSPFLEKLKAKDIEVLLMHDPIDEYMFQQIKEFKDHEFVSISKEGLDLGETEDEKSSFEALKESYAGLVEKVKAILGDKIEKAQLSNRIVNAPAVLVSTQHGLSANMERIMRNAALGNNQMMFGMGAKKIMELNADNTLIKELKNQFDKDPNARIIGDLIWLLYDTSVLTSGYSLDKPGEFANRIHRIVAMSFVGESELEAAEAQATATSSAAAEDDEDDDSDIEQVD